MPDPKKPQKPMQSPDREIPDEEMPMGDSNRNVKDDHGNKKEDQQGGQRPRVDQPDRDKRDFNR